MNAAKKIVCLMGPTASGKTQLALELMERFPFDIISVDSALVYRGLDIGTAKPSKELLKRAPHRLIDIRDPSDAYSAAQFVEDALRAIEDILASSRIPLLVGGTMLYFKALQQGMADMPTSDPVIRARLNEEGQKEGWPSLHDRLKKIDPSSAKRIHPNDSQRISRALEIFEMTGKTLTEWFQFHQTPLQDYSVINLAIAPEDRSVLHERIALRFHAMMKEGFLGEVEKLFKRGDLSLNTPAIRSVGYRQLWNYLEGNSSLEEAIEKSIIATRQLAKRQLTWLRSWPELQWFDSESKELVNEVSAYLNYCS